MEPVIEYDSGNRSLKFVFPRGGTYSFEDVPEHPDGFSWFARLVGDVDGWLLRMGESNRRVALERIAHEGENGFYAVRFEAMVRQALSRVGVVELLDVGGMGGPDFLVDPGEGPAFYVEASLSLFQNDPKLKEIAKWFTEDLKADSHWLTASIDSFELPSGYLNAPKIRSRLVAAVKEALTRGGGVSLDGVLVEVDDVRFRVHVVPSPNGKGFAGGIGFGGAFGNVRWLKNKFRDKDNQRKRWLTSIGREDWQPLYFLALGPDFSLVEPYNYDSDVSRVLGSYSKISGVLTFSFSAMGNTSGGIKLIANKGVDVPESLKCFLEGLSVSNWSEL